MVRARLLHDAAALPAFVEAWFNSTPGNEYVLEQATTTSGLYHIGAGKLGGAPVPLPDPGTQQTLITALGESLAGASAKFGTAKELRSTAWVRIEVETFGSPAEVVPTDPEPGELDAE